MYELSRIYASDRRAQGQVDALLAREGISRDRNLDYTVGLYDEAGELAATGSCFGQTLRCMAVDGSRRGEGLLAQIVTHLVEVEHERGYDHLFLYTKCDAARYFEELGFSEIARVAGRVVFMENRRGAFNRYLGTLRPLHHPGAAAIVMNANPFTLGHQYLAERAAAENARVFLFVLSEDVSLVPFEARFSMVQAGVAHLPGVTVLPSGLYMISSATFPSYFLKEADLVALSHARLDAAVFTHIAGALGVTRRYVGAEPFSHTTSLYNQALQEALPPAGVECTVLARRTGEGGPISASQVRRLLKAQGAEAIRPFVPESTYAFFQSEAGAAVIAAIRKADDVTHH